MSPSEHLMKYLLIAILALSNSFSAVAATLQCTTKGWNAGKRYTSYHTSKFATTEAYAQKLRLTLLYNQNLYFSSSQLSWNQYQTMLYYKHAMTFVEDQTNLWTNSQGWHGEYLYCTSSRCDIGHYDLPRNHSRRFQLDFNILKTVIGNLRLKAETNEGGDVEYFDIPATDTVLVGEAVSIPDTISFDAGNDRDSLSSQRVLEINNSPGSITIKPTNATATWHTNGDKNVFIYPSSTASSSTIPSSTTYTNKVGDPIYINLKVDKGAKSGVHTQQLSVTLNCP